ncbi:MAG: hypothetical protein ACK52W_02785, partial [Alphaproteobacteria bacterium]
RHREMYANDPEYRAKVDEITDQAQKLMDNAEKRRAASDAIAEKHGIHTNFDKEMEKLVKDRKKLDPTTPEARALEVRILEMERKQNEARIAELRRLGLEEEAKKLVANRPLIDEARKKAEELYNEQKDAYLKALESKLVAQRLSPEEIKEKTDMENARFGERLALAKDLNAILEMQRDLKSETARLSQAEREMVDKGALPSADYTVNSPKDKPKPIGSFPFQVAHASEVAPPQNFLNKKAETTIQHE